MPGFKYEIEGSFWLLSKISKLFTTDSTVYKL